MGKVWRRVWWPTHDLLVAYAGRKMAEFPLDPPFAKVLIQSKVKNLLSVTRPAMFWCSCILQAYKCTREVLSIIAMLSIDPIFFSPHDKREAATAAKKKFVNFDGRVTQIHKQGCSRRLILESRRPHHAPERFTSLPIHAWEQRMVCGQLYQRSINETSPCTFRDIVFDTRHLILTFFDRKSASN